MPTFSGQHSQNFTFDYQVIIKSLGSISQKYRFFISDSQNISLFIFQVKCCQSGDLCNSEAAAEAQLSRSAAVNLHLTTTTICYLLLTTLMSWIYATLQNIGSTISQKTLQCGIKFKVVFCVALIDPRWLKINRWIN